MIEYAIIGGTSLNQFEGLKIESESSIETSYGRPSDKIAIGKIAGHQVAFLNRHGKDSQIPPHKVNYRANIDALKGLGIKKIISVNAVGGIAEFATPLHISIPNQVIDYTHGRQQTFFDGEKEAVQFVDFTEPFSSTLRDEIVWASRELRLHESLDGASYSACYGCTQGPRLETAAEINRMERDGCDLVGMTLMPEAVLAKERNMEYASICLAVNWAAGRSDQPITMVEIRKLIQQGKVKIESLLLQVLKNIA